MLKFAGAGGNSSASFFMKQFIKSLTLVLLAMVVSVAGTLFVVKSGATKETFPSRVQSSSSVTATPSSESSISSSSALTPACPAQLANNSPVTISSATGVSSPQPISPAPTFASSAPNLPIKTPVSSQGALNGSHGGAISKGPSSSQGVAPVSSSNASMPANSAPAQQVVDVPPNASVPAVLAQPGPTSTLDPASQQEVAHMADNFLNAVDTQTSSGTPRDQAWQTQQMASDDAFRARYGVEAYNAESAMANLQARGASH